MSEFVVVTNRNTGQKFGFPSHEVTNIQENGTGAHVVFETIGDVLTVETVTQIVADLNA